MPRCDRVIAIGMGLFALLAAPSASATPVANAKIPPNDFGCALCHSHEAVTFEEVPEPVAGVLSGFGLQWLALDPDDESGRLWAEQAPQNADSDGCSNGYELGDPRGEYLQGAEPAGAPINDPNRVDCTLPINSESWSTLKALFSDQ